MSTIPDASATAPRTLPVPPAPGQRVHVSTTVTVAGIAEGFGGSWLTLDYEVDSAPGGLLTLELDECATITPVDEVPPSTSDAVADARAEVARQARLTVLEFAATRGLTYLPAHCWGYVRSPAMLACPAELVAVAVEAASAAHDEVRARYAVDGHVGLRTLLDVERATLGGAS